MRKFDLRQSSFAGGVIGDHAHGRTDLSKYHVGVRVANNMIPLAHGPLLNRPGTEFLMHSRLIDWPYSQNDSELSLSPVKLQAFEYAEEDTYMVAFGHKHIRFFRNGAPVLESTTKSVSSVLVTTPTRFVCTTDHGWQHMDLIYITGIVGGTAEGYNDRYWYALTHQNQINVLSVTPGSPTLIITDGNHGFTNGRKVYMDDLDGTAGADVQRQKLVLTTTANPDEFTVPIDTSLLAAGGAGGWVMEERWAAGTDDSLHVADMLGNEMGPVSGYSSGGTIYRVAELRRYRMLDELDDVAYDRVHLQRLRSAQSAAVMPVAHRSYAPRELVRIDHDDWTFEKITFEARIDTPEGLNVDLEPSSGEDVTWYVTAVADETREESASATIVSKSPDTGPVDISWNAVTGAKYYNVYRTDDTFRRAGFVGLVESDTPSFHDPGTVGTINPDFTIGPPFPGSPFGDDGDDTNPGVVTFYEQRLHWASTVEKPQQVWSSVAGVYYNMNESIPVYPDDAFSWIVASERENNIENLIPLDALIVATSAKQHKVTGANGGPLTAEPGGVEPKPGAKYGSSWLEALRAGDGALYVTSKGPKVRDAAYDFATNSYKGGEKSILASHFFEGYTIVDWTYAESPFSIVLLARNDGKVISMTHHPEHEVEAWALTDFSGIVESIEAVREGNEDYVYLVVRRDIDGNVVRYYERIHSRDFRNYDNVWDVRNAYFVDCGASLDDPHPAVPQNENAEYYVDETNGRFYLADADSYFTADTGTWGSSPNWDGDYVDLDDFQGTGGIEAALNGYQFYVTAATATYIEIALVEDPTGVGDYTDIDATYMSGWDCTRFGSVRKCVTEISNLHHLEGETVSILANGSVGVPQVVASGTITIPEDVSPASRVHVGLPIPEVDVEFLDAENPDPTDPIGHLPQSLDSAHLMVRHSRGIWWGPDVDSLSPRKERTHEHYMQPIEPETGVISTRNLPLTGEFDHSRLYIRQPDPLPLEIMAVVRGIILDQPG